MARLLLLLRVVQAPPPLLIVHRDCHNTRRCFFLSVLSVLSALFDFFVHQDRDVLSKAYQTLTCDLI